MAVVDVVAVDTSQQGFEDVESSDPRRGLSSEREGEAAVGVVVRLLFLLLLLQSWDGYSDSSKEASTVEARQQQGGRVQLSLLGFEAIGGTRQAGAWTGRLASTLDARGSESWG